MRFSRKRRRRPVEWITTNYSSFPDNDGAHTGILPLCTVVFGGPAQTANSVNNETPILVGDEPDVANSLTEERKSYTIRRIVGDMHFMWGRDSTVGTGGTAGIQPIMAKWGFAVKNVPPDVASLVPTGERVWNSFTDQARDFSEMDWMSMKTEVYGANLLTYPTNNPLSAGWGGNYDNNFNVTSIIEGKLGYGFPYSRAHHVDIKVNRTVRRNQRLFLNVCLAPFEFDAAVYDWTKNAHKMVVYTDLRVLINWRAAYNRKG